MRLESADRLRLLADASRILDETSLEYTATLEAIAEFVVPRIADDCVVFIVEDGVVRRVAEASVSEQNLALLRELRANPPAMTASNAVLSAVRSGHTMHIEEVDDHILANLAGSTSHEAALRAVHPTTFITVPLFARGVVIGAITFGMSVSSRRYQAEDVAVAEEIGRRAGMAVENARLFREAVDARRRAEAAERQSVRLQASTSALSRAMSAAEAGATVLEHGVGLFAAKSGAVYVRQAGELALLAGTEHQPSAAALEVSRTGEPIVGESALILPLVVEGSVIGAIELTFSHPRTLFLEELAFAEALASQAALSIDRAILLDRDRDRVDRAAFLDDVNELLASSLDSTEMLGELARRFVPRFGKACTIELGDIDSNRACRIVPLVAKSAPIGAIYLDREEPFAHADASLFAEIVHRTALAVERAQLYRDLRQAVQVRDDFLAAAGHELKTPLAALLMHVDSMHRQLRKNIVPTNLYQRLEKASRAGVRLERLIDELLDVSRITAGRLALEPEVVQLDELVREVADRFIEAGESKIVVTTEPVSGTWDRGRIDQVVSNLISNALKYGRGQPIEVDVKGGEHAVLRVVDHGIGIAAEEQQKIFERFERAVENREFGGFGLGLWIARQIVETSGGTIEVCSAPGRGATFTVTLPR